ncbi:MAG: class I SAM-dependent methyltransferase, partial [Acidimicrobiia bacterium]
DALDGEVDLLYVDGAHGFGPARADLSAWGARVRPGGTMLVHDAFSSVGVTLALGATAAVGRRFRYVGRSRSMVEYRVEALGPVARVGNALRHLAQLPWFARNLVLKAVLVVGGERWARRLGHRDAGWPY